MTLVQRHWEGSHHHDTGWWSSIDPRGPATQIQHFNINLNMLCKQRYTSNTLSTTVRRTDCIFRSFDKVYCQTEPELYAVVRKKNTVYTLAPVGIALTIVRMYRRVDTAKGAVLNRDDSRTPLFETHRKHYFQKDNFLQMKRNETNE